MHPEEDEFIEKFKREVAPLTHESEILARYCFSIGFRQGKEIAYRAGRFDQKHLTLSVLGAVPVREPEPEA